MTDPQPEPPVFDEDTPLPERAPSPASPFPTEPPPEG